MKSFGTYGDNPLKQLHSEDAGKITLHELNIGTTKITSHIPGYNGYLPKTDINEQAITQGLGVHTRETFIKQNIVEN